MPPIYYIKDGSLSFGDKSVLEDIELYISPGDLVCLIGRNGCGKSSLMKIIYGEYELDSGKLFKDTHVQIGYLKQDMKNIPNMKIYDYILSDFKEKEESKYLADMVLSNLQIDGSLNLQNCSGGQMRRAFLAKSLVTSPDILLLDEPTNHLDIKAIEWLEEYVKSYNGAIICISHDRRFLENTTNRIWWIDRGHLRKSNQGFKYFDKWQEQVIIEEESILRNMNKKLELEKNWLNTGVTARRKRNQRRLKNLHQLREDLQEHNIKINSAKARLQYELSDEIKKTKFIIEAENLTLAYSGASNTGTSDTSTKNKQIISDFSIKIQKGEKIGILGPNGAGKTSLIRLLTKEIEADTGFVKHGINLEITYFDQHRTQLNPKHTLKKTLCPTGGDQIFLKDRTMHVAGYLKNFMFDPKRLNETIDTLSGGEAGRLLLAKSLINPGNLLILDEPTNDLDMDSLEILQEILAEYDGTLLVVSHDRDFLEKLVTRSLVFTNEGKIIDLYGGYEDYLKYYASEDKSLNKFKNKATKNKETTKTTYQRAIGPNNNKEDSSQRNSIPNSRLLSSQEEALEASEKVEFGTKSIITDTKPIKLSYKYARLLEVLPQQIEALEQEIKSLERKLEDPDLYLDFPDKFHQYSTELFNAKKELENKIEEWVQIESMQ